MKSNNKRLLLFLLAVPAVLTTSLHARAGFAPMFVGSSPAGSNTAYSYDLVFSTTAGLESVIGTGAIDPGVPGSRDFLTIFDVPGLVSATAPAGFAVQVQLAGIAGPFQNPTDNPALPNVTFSYTGADLTADTVITGATIVSSFNATALGLYSSQRTDAIGFDAGTKIGETGYTVIPAIPEPSTMALVGVASLGLLRRRMRRRTD